MKPINKMNEETKKEYGSEIFKVTFLVEEMTEGLQGLLWGISFIQMILK